MRTEKIYYLEKQEYIEVKVFQVRNNLSLKKIAEQLKMSVSHLDNVIRGKVPFSQEIREKFEKELGLYFEK